MNKSLETQALTDFILSTESEYLLQILCDLRAHVNKYQYGGDLGQEYLLAKNIFRAQAYALMTESVAIAVDCCIPVPYEIALDFCTSLDSLDRGILLVSLQGGMSTDDWAKLFINQWTSIETADYLELPDLKRAVATVGIPCLRKHMQEQDLAHYNDLPDLVTVYRGCANGGDGVSWSLRKEVADLFVLRKDGAYIKGHMQLRLLSSTQDQGLREDIYTASPKKAQVYLGEVSKEDCLVFFHRNEQEIFSLNVKTLRACN